MEKTLSKAQLWKQQLDNRELRDVTRFGWHDDLPYSIAVTFDVWTTLVDEEDFQEFRASGERLALLVDVLVFMVEKSGRSESFTFTAVIGSVPRQGIEITLEVVRVEQEDGKLAFIARFPGEQKLMM